MLLKRHSVIEWSVVAVCVAGAAAVVLWRTRTYERKGTLLDMQARVQSADASMRRYNAALLTVMQGAGRAKVDRNPVVCSTVLALQQRRDEATIRALNAQVNFRMAAFAVSDVEILTNFTSLVQATNVMKQLLREGIQTQIGGLHFKDPRKFLPLLVRKSDASRAHALLPGLLADHGTPDAEK